MRIYLRTHQAKVKIIFIIIILGVLFILSQLLQNRGMWIDEAALALDIRDLSFSELLKPLESGQVAPILYLLIQKTFISLFGNSDIVFRIFPVISIFLSTVFLYKILLKLGCTRNISLLGVGLFIIHPEIIYYSSEAKQYPLDVFAVLSALLIILKIISLNRLKEKILMGTLVIPLFFLSNATIIIIPAIALLMIYTDHIIFKRIQISTLLIIFMFVIGFTSYYHFFIGNHSNRLSMLEYWKGRGLPSDSINSTWEFLVWSKEIIWKHLFYRLLAFEKLYISILCVVIVIIGIFLLAKKRKIKVLILTLVPFFTHLTLSLFLFYPFYKR